MHGWLGSWGLWQQTMTILGQNCRTYALDFWGFGESGKKRNTYAVNDFVSLVDQFMDRLGIAQAPLVGHSMGGTVSLSVALQYPHRAEKVVIIGSPIVGSSLALPLKMAGTEPVAFLLFHMMGVFRQGMRLASPFICRDPRFPDMMDKDLSQTTLESFLTSIASLRRTDLRADLHQIKIPVMGMFGKRDNIVDPNQWNDLQQGVSQSRIELFDKAGHFIMLDEPELFIKKMQDFLDIPSVKL
ncbi:MAG: alpha/beta hydrolase [Anaerolineaceae bacterium]|nr:alpha/beta hydrolase [Anaerolineaceae bacterium]